MKSVLWVVETFEDGRWVFVGIKETRKEARALAKRLRPYGDKVRVVKYERAA